MGVAGVTGAGRPPTEPHQWGVGPFFWRRTQPNWWGFCRSPPVTPEISLFVFFPVLLIIIPKTGEKGSIFSLLCKSQIPKTDRNMNQNVVFF